MKSIIKKQAILMRKQGSSLLDISQKLHISKSTASLWLRDFPLNRGVLIERQKMNGARMGAIQKRRRVERENIALQEARKEIGELNKRDLFMLGVALYVGEGTKWQNLVRIVNSDPKVIRLAVRWLREICNVDKKSIFLRIHGYPDTNFKKAREYWGDISGIDKTNFQSNVVDKRVGKSEKRGVLPFGTIHVTVVGDGRAGTSLGLKIRKWMEVVLD